jgi:hypothetical protein
VTQRDMHYKFTGRFTIRPIHFSGFYIRTRAETGNSFNNDHNCTAIGLGKKSHTFNLKDLYAGLHVSDQVELQAGGIEYDFGAGSQATYADSDGWLEGYRVVLRRKSGPAVFDRLSLTAGYVGDFGQPNVFRRLNRLGRFNYFQILAVKAIGKSTDASIETSGFNGIPFVRGGLKRRTSNLKLIDEVGVDAIFRTGHNQAFGWSSTASRQLGSRKQWRLTTTFSDIPVAVFDRKGTQVVQNGDSMGLGKRLGCTCYFSPKPNLEIVVFASRRLDETPGVRNRAQIALRYQFASLLNR